MTARNMKVAVRLTEMELRAAHIALSNYTPDRGVRWKQGAQSRAATKIQKALISIVQRKISR